jgi:hypothetical protein
MLAPNSQSPIADSQFGPPLMIGYRLSAIDHSEQASGEL